MSSSESDEDETSKLKEAAIVFSMPNPTENGHTKHIIGSINGNGTSHKISKRISATYKEEGNELNTTPEFRSYVAKKLEAFLDSNTKCCGKEVDVLKDLQTSSVDTSGFRLFSSSCGEWVTEEEVNQKFTQKRRKRRKSSSSDNSSEDERLQEAVVPDTFLRDKAEKDDSGVTETISIKRPKKCKHKTKDRDFQDSLNDASSEKHKKKTKSSGD